MKYSAYINKIKKNDASLTEIVIENEQVSDQQIAELIKTLAKHEDVARRIKIFSAPCCGLKKTLDLRVLNNLELLYLTNNNFTEPPILSGLTQLRTIFLSNNNISTPPDLTGLTSLFEIHLDKNDLVTPPILDGNKALNKVILEYNKLKMAPSIHGLNFLKILNIQNNPITTACEISLRIIKMAPNNRDKILYTPSELIATELNDKILEESFKKILQINHKEMIIYFKRIGILYLSAHLPAEIIAMLTKFIPTPEIERANAVMYNFEKVFESLPEPNTQLSILNSYKNSIQAKAVVNGIEGHYASAISSFKNIISVRKKIEH